MRSVPILRSRVIVAGVFAVVAFSLPLHAAQVSQGQAGGAPQGTNPSRQIPKDFFHPPGPDDTAGFVQIFDGKTLEGWDGDPTSGASTTAPSLARARPRKSSVRTPS